MSPVANRRPALNGSEGAKPSSSATLDRKTKGRIAEAKVISYLTDDGYELYIPLYGGSEIDVIGNKEGMLHRFSIKYTSARLPSGNWSVRLANVSRRNYGAVHIKLFDCSRYDFLAVYIHPEDRVCIVPCNFLAKKEIAIPRSVSQRDSSVL